MRFEKKILKHILLFAAWVLLVNQLVYWFLAKPVLYQDYFIRDSRLDQYNSFLLGDSHAGVIRQQDLDRIHTANFAFNSDSYFDIYNKLNYLISRHHVDTLYLCVDDHTLSVYREWWTNANRSIRYSDYRHYTRYYPDRIRDYLYGKYISIYLPLFDTGHSELLGKRIGMILRGEKQANFDHYDFSVVPVQRRRTRSRDRIATQYPRPERSEKLYTCLEEMMTLCTSEEINLVGIKFPLTREFYEELGSRSYGADSVLQSHGYPVLDYKTEFVDSCSYFRDQDHLNHRGSKMFVDQLRRDLYSGGPLQH